MTIEALAAKINAVPSRIRLAGAIAIVVVAIGSIVAVVVSHAPRTNLFASPLRSDQLAEVQAELAAWAVPFTPLADNVVVDAGARNALLLKLSLAGVPHAHVETTNETLASVGVLTPQAIVDAQTRSGLAGDIELGLRSVDGVDDARVIIAPAKPAEFADESARDASASVRLRLHPGAAMSREAIAGIRQFVAASVAGLDAARVTILDDRGLALTDASAAPDDSAMQRSLQSALDAALGPGNAIVRVTTAYSRATTERRDTLRSPLRTVPVTRDDVSESFDSEGKHYQKREFRDDRGSDTSEVVSRSEPGDVIRVSTAIFVDASRGFDLEKIRDLSAATVGYDRKRGDSLVVQAVDFHREVRQKHDAWFLAYGTIVPLLPSLATVIGLIVIVRLTMPVLAPTLASLVEHRALDRKKGAVAGYAPAHVRGVLKCEPPHAAAAIISALPAATAAAVLELYPPHEREAIVVRMQRAHSPLVPNIEEVLGRHA